MESNPHGLCRSTPGCVTYQTISENMQGQAYCRISIYSPYNTVIEPLAYLFGLNHIHNSLFQIMANTKGQLTPELEFAQLEINARAHAHAFVAKEIKVSKHVLLQGCKKILAMAS